MDTSAPSISVVILVGVQREGAERSLARVLSQKGLDQAEILLLDNAADQYPPLIGSNHPIVHVVPINGDATLGGRRSHAIHLAQGEVVAFVEEPCRGNPGLVGNDHKGYSR